MHDLRKRAVLPILRWISPKVAASVTHSIVRLLPEAKWYPATFHITKRLTGISELLAGEVPLRAQWKLHFWLKHLFSYNRPFPIPIRPVGADALFQARAHSSGTVLVSVHLPLTHLVTRCLVEIGYPPDAVVTSGISIKPGKFPVGGRSEELTALAAQSGSVLLEARSILRRGGFVAALIDTEMGAPLNPNILRFVGTVGARLVFALTEIQKSGEVFVRFHCPPDPFCRSKEGIFSNIEFLRERVALLLRAKSLAQSEFSIHPSAEPVSHEYR